jgi:hypothetical protein
MGNDQQKHQADSEAKVEEEIRKGRKFSATEAIGRLAGPGAMKGASPVSRVQQAETEIGGWLRSNVADSSGALQLLLHRNLKGSELLLANLDQPLRALAGYCRKLLDSDHLLEEFVREADVEWGRRMDERPRFERDGSPHDPGDPYTVRSVRQTLHDTLKQLPNAGGEPASY